MRPTTTLLALISLCLVQSCILEDRTDCPAYLTLDLSSLPGNVELVHLVLEHESGEIYQDTVLREDFATGSELPVRKGVLNIAAYGNPDRMTFDKGYYVHEGGQADSLYTCFHTTTCYTDLARDTIRVSKNFIGLHIRILGEAQAGDSIHICIESSSIGYDLKGNILEGKFRHSPEALHVPDGERQYYEFYSQITGQARDDLTLTINADRDSSSMFLASVGLAGHLKDNGTDMAGEGLPDLYITVDFAQASIRVSPVDWDYNEHIEIEI